MRFPEDYEQLPEATIAELCLKAQAGDTDARNRVAESFIPLVLWAAKRFDKGSSVGRDDLIGHGFEILLGSIIPHFRPGAGPFYPYAKRTLVAELHKHRHEHGGPVRLPCWLIQHVTHYRRLNDPDLTPEDFAATRHGRAETQRGHEETHRCIAAAIRSHDRGQEVGQNFDEPDDGGADPFEVAGLADEVAVVRDRVATMLPDREREVIERRFGFGGREPETLRVIGADLGYTRERIRQIEVGAISRLRELMTAKAS